MIQDHEPSTRGSDQSEIVLSVVVPMYNEEGSIRLFWEQAVASLDDLGIEWELICVDDGSIDRTRDEVLRIRQHDRRVKLVRLSRNFGKELALLAGLDFAAGRAVVQVDADLQHPLETVPRLIAKWQEGYQVVTATRRSRATEPWFKRSLTSVFYRIFGHLSGNSTPGDLGDFCLLDRCVVDVLVKCRERNRFSKGMVPWAGFKRGVIGFEVAGRRAGSSKWSYWRLWNHAIQGITSFSSWPLRLWIYVGLMVAVLSLSYATFIVVRTAFLGIDVPGYASLMTAVLFMGGIQLISLGVLGEYVGRIHDETKGRLPYVVAETQGLDQDRPVRLERLAGTGSEPGSRPEPSGAHAERWR